MSIIGTPTINRYWFFTGKLAAAICLFFTPVQLLHGNVTCYVNPVVAIAGLCLYFIGAAIVMTGIFNLGQSTYMGLPNGETSLKTQGIYRYSRNPIYLGLLIACLGSCLYVIHPANILCAFLSTGVHHRIIMAEERFLASRFGEAWGTYTRKVRRYI